MTTQVKGWVRVAGEGSVRRNPTGTVIGLEKPARPARVLVACPRCGRERLVHPRTAEDIALHGRGKRLCKGCASAQAHERRVATPAAPAPCRHCGIVRVLRPRGLCTVHYQDKSVRNLYPASAENPAFGRASAGAFANVKPKTPAHPTAAAPGSVRKLRVMAARFERGESVLHEADARYPGDPRPYEWFKRVSGVSGDAPARATSRSTRRT